LGTVPRRMKSIRLGTVPRIRKTIRLGTVPRRMKTIRLGTVPRRKTNGKQERKDASDAQLLVTCFGDEGAHPRVGGRQSCWSTCRGVCSKEARPKSQTRLGGRYQSKKESLQNDSNHRDLSLRYLLFCRGASRRNPCSDVRRKKLKDDPLGDCTS
jgi:hypothetical protein